ncbi:MCP four helix bundle domain-containing protein [Demequina sp. TTPB684]|uniref:MCP four helix bundle domain-containing protein n=1 Tax=unclassified Demequina TaxID=2620311 RepID=UPI001CF4557A|nr:MULTISPECIES: MCP four helix bundle domain-containing protein [unclassified Demequina]MCB2413320.1 MCP four helix bundle domain-containing protein [Demequina sp. TTPB684]UPU88961.1 MCP four helix bundle domain-containing protein [Demequina sp. TMPB413]
MGRWVRNQGIAVRVLGAIGIALIVAVAVGAGGILSMRTMDAGAQEVATVNLPGVHAAGELRVAVDDLRMEVVNHLLADNVADKTAVDQKILERTQGVQDALAEFEAITVDPEAAPIIEHFRASLEKYLGLVQ